MVTSMTYASSTCDLIDDLHFATDFELALAYYHSDEPEAKFPLYMIVNELHYRGMTFDELEGLLIDY